MTLNTNPVWQGAALCVLAAISTLANARTMMTTTPHTKVTPMARKAPAWKVVEKSRNIHEFRLQ